uniref:GST C-terminal domain-containing protein n=1 Tax=Bicosoecida sp. CB-2014 TaxID=1486930 RepID=A0A7S1G4S3_9STRA
MASESKRPAGSDAAKHALTAETAKKGAWIRAPTKFHESISNDGSTPFPAAAGRYRLYHAPACPWANRCTAVIKLKGLGHVIEVVAVGDDLLELGNATPGAYRGWNFRADGSSDPDGWGFDHIDQLYEMAAPGFRKSYEAQGRAPYYSVPVLFDKETKKIVNNESAEIIVMLNSQFNAFATNPDLDLAPSDLADAMDAINDKVYPYINDGVYRSGFARAQEAYTDAVTKLFETLDWLEDILSRQRYTTGDRLTLADIRLWSTLVRFDMVYVTHFKCNIRRLHDYPNLWGFMLEITQLPTPDGGKLGDTVLPDHIKAHYYGSHRGINPFGIIPVGFEIDLAEPHGRDKKFPVAEESATA